ncbi:MAG: hypothetical protein ACK4MM_06135, partial [Fervidobacterium sp.]
MKINDWFKSLRARFVIYILLLGIFSIVIVSVVVKTTTENVVVSALKGYFSVLKEVVDGLDIEIFQKVVKNPKKGTEEFEVIHSYLNSYLKKYPLMKYIYTVEIDLTSKKCIILVDGTDYGDEFSEPGYEESLPEVKEISTNEPFSSKICTEEPWGTLITLYYPIKDKSNNTIAYLAADLRAEGLKASIQKNVLTVSLLILILIFVSYLLTSSILKSINRLLPIFEKFSNYDYSEESLEYMKEMSKRSDEIGIISKAVLKIQISMKALIKDVIQSEDKINYAAENLLRNSGKLLDIVDANVSFVSEMLKQSQNISTSIEETTSGIEGIAASSQVLADSSTRLQEAINNVVKLTKAGEETIKKINEQVDNTQSVVEKTVEEI